MRSSAAGRSIRGWFQVGDWLLNGKRWWSVQQGSPSEPSLALSVEVNNAACVNRVIKGLLAARV